MISFLWCSKSNDIPGSERGRSSAIDAEYCGECDGVTGPIRDCDDRGHFDRLFLGIAGIAAVHITLRRNSFVVVNLFVVVVVLDVHMPAHMPGIASILTKIVKILCTLFL